VTQETWGIAQEFCADLLLHVDPAQSLGVVEAFTPDISWQDVNTAVA